MKRNIIFRRYTEGKYYLFFNPNNGLLIRKEFEGQNEPFWSTLGPELLDISITNYCERGCDFCYRNSCKQGTHMALLDYEIVLSQARKIGVVQIALGGGNPNQHPYFIKILELTHEYGIVPSYTTNGDGITDEILNVTQKTCGAVAVSLYEPYSSSWDAIKRFTNKQIKTNIHFVLNDSTINVAIDLLRNVPVELKDINAIIFLNYKPMHKSAFKTLNYSERVAEFFKMLDTNLFNFKIGFDSCCISYIIKNVSSYDFSTIDFCEAGRFSAFISEDMRMFPCSFMIKNYDGRIITRDNMLEIWTNGEDFKCIREKIAHNKCINKCKYESICKGGCSIYPNINYC